MSLSDHIKKKHFLICDDYESIRTLLLEDLRSLGVEKISTASSGNEALELMGTFLGINLPAEFLITDLVMDDGTGIELVKKIRKSTSPKISGVPVLMLTSKAEISFVVESAKAGVNNYIVKPWTKEELAKRITEVCAKLKV